MIVELSWKSWYGNETLPLTFPDAWDTTVVRLPERSPLTDDAIAAVLEQPIGSPRLTDLPLAGRRICIAVDDLTKPTQAYRIFPPLLAQLGKAGVRDGDIRVLIAMGTHRALTRGDMVRKLGASVVERFCVYNHSAYQNNVLLGHTSAGTPVSINRLFVEADFKIGVGMLMPHNLAGFSGGGKLVFPGLADIDSVEANHRPTLRGLQGAIGRVDGNAVRRDIDEAARMAGLNFIVNSVHNERGETVDLFCGDPVLAFREAAGVAARYYACAVPYGNDIGVFNAFPRDNWFLLSLSSLDVWSTRDPHRQVVAEGGTIVIVNHCSEGAGEHGLHTIGMRHFVKRNRHGTFREILAGRTLIFLSPNVHEGILRDYYDGVGESVFLERDWAGVLKRLEARHGAQARVAVFPAGTLQMDAGIVETPAAG